LIIWEAQYILYKNKKSAIFLGGTLGMAAA
jgi:hypothetical protein